MTGPIASVKLVYIGVALIIVLLLRVRLLGGGIGGSTETASRVFGGHSRCQSRFGHFNV